MYLNILKNKKKLKKKYLRYLEKFYFNWRKYNQELILELEYPKLYQDFDCRIRIKNFLDIKDDTFLKNFPKFEKYKKDKNFIDPSTILMRDIYNLK